uniref:Uncharacterized protein n=1 Tax=Onchocerca volvulus TaxID=6282 RepID=A0A8R1Y0K9_ONCVO
MHGISVVPANPVRMKPPTMNWLMNNGPPSRFPIASSNVYGIFLKQKISLNRSRPPLKYDGICRREDGPEDGPAECSSDPFQRMIVAALASPLALLASVDFCQMVFEMMEIISEFQKSYYNTTLHQPSQNKFCNRSILLLFPALKPHLTYFFQLIII